MKNPPAMQEMWVRSLGQEDSLEKEVATHSSILAWKTPWTEEPNRLQSMGSQRVGNDLVTKQQLHGIAALAYILFGQMTCRCFKLTQAHHSGACPGKPVM